MKVALFCSTICQMVVKESIQAKVYFASWYTWRKADHFTEDGLASIVVSFITNTRELNQARLGGFVVLPEEVQLIFSPTGNHSFDSVVRYIRRASERLINRELQRTGEVWDEMVSEKLIKDERALNDTLRKIEFAPCQRNIVKYPSDYSFSHVNNQYEIDDLSGLF